MELNPSSLVRGSVGHIHPKALSFIHLHPTFHCPSPSPGFAWQTSLPRAVPWSFWPLWLHFYRQWGMMACEWPLQDCSSLNTDFCSKSTSVTRNSCSLQVHWSNQIHHEQCKCHWVPPWQLEEAWPHARGSWHMDLVWASHEGFLSLAVSRPYAAERLTHMSRQGESHLYSTFKHKALHTKCSRAVLASGFILVPLLHLPLATASCVTEKYGIFIPYLRPSLCSFTVPWKPNFYSCQQITFRQTEECVVAWISSFFFFF